MGKVQKQTGQYRLSLFGVPHFSQFAIYNSKSKSATRFRKSTMGEDQNGAK